mgnify:CR=1 FL=1
MSNEIMQENTPFVECSAFHRGMSVLEANLRNTEDSEAIISGLLKGAAEFYGASRECTNYFKCNFAPITPGYGLFELLPCNIFAKTAIRYIQGLPEARLPKSVVVPFWKGRA